MGKFATLLVASVYGAIWIVARRDQEFGAYILEKVALRQDESWWSRATRKIALVHFLTNRDVERVCEFVRLYPITVSRLFGRTRLDVIECHLAIGEHGIAADLMGLHRLDAKSECGTDVLRWRGIQFLYDLARNQRADTTGLRPTTMYLEVHERAIADAVRIASGARLLPPSRGA